MDKGDEDFWETFCEHIDEGEVIPIIGNWVRTGLIFDIDRDRDLGRRQPEEGYPEPDTVEELEREWNRELDYPFPSKELLAGIATYQGVTGEDEELLKRSGLRFLRAYLLDLESAKRRQLNVEEELAEAWARKIGYPFPDKHRLARVALYNRVNARDLDAAKRGYLRFLKEKLLELAEADEPVPDKLDEFKRGRIGTIAFSDIAIGLGYPRFEDEKHDPLRQLAALRLPIYVTTSHFDFMERALVATDKHNYRIHVCSLFGAPSRIDPKHRPDPGFVPTRDEPVVVHLHGLETDPSSLVLSEDDYLDFVATAAKYEGVREDPFIPLYLQERMADWSLILLGYRLYDWDFRVLFRGLIKPRPPARVRAGLVMQVDPAEQTRKIHKRRARNYLKKFFEGLKLKVEWGTPQGVVMKLCNIYDDWRGDQV